MTKNKQKATSYLVMAICILSTILPVISDQYRGVLWISAAAATATALWRARDYWESEAPSGNPGE